MRVKRQVYRLKRQIYNKNWRRRTVRRLHIWQFWYERFALQKYRKFVNYDIEQDYPLVSVTIATYNRADLLIERAVSSALAQSYPNIEVIVVGDACTDDTAERIAQLNDPRVYFENLTHRGPYPEDKINLWRVAGTYPINRALLLARGKWIAHLDDDEIFLPNHIENLIKFATKNKYEMVHSKLNLEESPGNWVIAGEDKLDTIVSRIRHSTVLFRSYLKFFQFYIDAWKVGLAVDKHIWLRMKQAGINMGFLDEVLTEAPLRPGTTVSEFNAEDRNAL